MTGLERHTSVCCRLSFAGRFSFCFQSSEDAPSWTLLARSFSVNWSTTFDCSDILAKEPRWRDIMRREKGRGGVGRVHRLESQWTGSLVDEEREESIGGLWLAGKSCATSPYDGRGGKCGTAEAGSGVDDAQQLCKWSRWNEPRLWFEVAVVVEACGRRAESRAGERALFGRGKMVWTNCARAGSRWFRAAQEAGRDL